MKRRNKFSLSHFKLLTGKMGYLYPIACVETLPGDTFQMATSVFLRFSPMVAPVMTPVTVKIHHWFVPLRLIWEDFEDFITGGPDGTSVPQVPWMTIQEYFGLEPYFDLPNFDFSNGQTLPRISVLPFRAYNLIWNEWYRDQNLQEPTPFSKASGWSGSNLTPRYLLKSPWDKDYFTTATPWEQKGAAVNVPINSTSVDVTFPTQINFSGSMNWQYDTSGEGVINRWTMTGQDGGISGPGGTISATGTTSGTFDTTIGNLDLNQFREAMALQRFEEHRALYGSRYVEYLRYLGVKASDGRLQRPEYLGGGRSVIQFSEVLQTAQDGDTPVGTMRGHGIGAMRTNRFRRFFEEHGYVITLLSIRPKSIYMQGIPKHFLRRIKTDYWQKELEHIGQQEIFNKELYAQSDNPDGVFGYSDRYDEYRHVYSTVTGEFRDLLNYWHLGREFANQPVLNSDFVSSLPSDRIFADRTGNDTIYMMVNNSIQARRLVSRHGTPR